MGKPWYLSKTVWANFIAIAGIPIVTYMTGFELTVREATILLMLMGAVNILLRTKTSEALGG